MLQENWLAQRQVRDLERVSKYQKLRWQKGNMNILVHGAGLRVHKCMTLTGLVSCYGEASRATIYGQVIVGS